MANDPTSQIQSLISAYAKKSGEYVAVVAGIISPNVAAGPSLLYGGTSLLNTAHDPITLGATTPFEIGSVTKIFTSIVAYLYGKYSGTVGSALSVLKAQPPAAAITLAQLANYCPGFTTDNHGGWWPAGTAGSLSNLAGFLSTTTLKVPQTAPGTCYSYSNFGWGLLALSALGLTSLFDNVAALWGQRIATVATDLNLSSATAPYASSIDAQLPVGYDKSGQIFPVGRNYAPLSPMLAGAGDVISNGDDMMLFLQFNMGKTDPTNQMLLAQQEPVSQMRVQCPPDGKKPPPEVGYGWFHHPITVGGEPVTYLAKDGGVGGFTSWLGFQAWAGSGVASSTGAFVLTNSHGALNLGTQIIKILLGDPAAQQEDAETNYVPPVD